MKGSKKSLGFSEREVPPCRFLHDIHEMEDVDNLWTRQLRIMKFNEDVSKEQYDYDALEGD